MESNKELDDILRLLDGRSLSMAIEQLGTFGCKYPELNLSEPLDGIRDDYERMAEYWERGYRDPQLEDIYNRLLCRMYRLASDVYLRYATAHSSYLSGINRRLIGAGRDWSLAVLRSSLEEFVSNVALLELEPDSMRKQKRDELYAGHQRLMNDLFDYLWMSPQWTEGTADAFEDILLSPTVDANDQQLIISAVMLSTMNRFDINKFRLLVNVYRHSSDENVRQRALAGWVLSVGKGCYRMFPEQKRLVDELLADDGVCDELTELQIQILYCVSAESDNKKIQKEIMPELLKNNNLHITRNGIEEKAEDPMQDILDPEASERNMEKVEESFRKMMDMQKAGSDIYFGGFSQMKHFPFFDNVSNWFVPFYPEHPEISRIYDTMGNSKFIDIMMNSGPFCNSDKYSLLMAFRQVLDRMPQNMRELLDSGEIAGIGEFPDCGQQTPAYIRRICLQDIYRFFRLFPSRSQFYNPFDHRKAGKRDSDYIFFANDIFRNTPLERHFGEIGSFLLKRKMFREAAELLDNYGDGAKGYQFYMLCGHVLLHRGEAMLHPHLSGMTAAGSFRHALSLKTDDSRAMLGYARAMFYDGNYQEACDAYARLTEANPENRAYQLGYSVCLTNLERYDEAMKVLYKLNYENPDDDNVNRIMARALIGGGKYEQADKIYVRLRENGKMDENDLLNLGYCKWFAGNHRTAVDCFVKYLKTRYPDSSQSYYRERIEEEIIATERDFILGHGVTPTEILLMVDRTCAALL